MPHPRYPCILPCGRSSNIQSHSSNRPNRAGGRYIWVFGNQKGSQIWKFPVWGFHSYAYFCPFGFLLLHLIHYHIKDLRWYSRTEIRHIFKGRWSVSERQVSETVSLECHSASRARRAYAWWLGFRRLSFWGRFLVSEVVFSTGILFLTGDSGVLYTLSCIGCGCFSLRMLMLWWLWIV